MGICCWTLSTYVAFMILMYFPCRYLNTTFIKKQKYTEADLSYGNFAVELSDQMLEIGEVRKLLYNTVKTLYNVTLYNRIFNIRHKFAGNRSVSIKIPS